MTGIKLFARYVVLRGVMALLASWIMGRGIANADHVMGNAIAIIAGSILSACITTTGLIRFMEEYHRAHW